jgi:hypothetical protein
MSKTSVLAFALLISAAAFAAAAEAPPAAEAKNADVRKACEREATLKLYTGKQRSKFVRQCLAGIRPPGPTATPMIAPLADPRSTSGGTAPSNAAVAPSAPVIGSTGTSTTGSSATSISGSSGTSIGSSRGR